MDFPRRRIVGLLAANTALAIAGCGGAYLARSGVNQDVQILRSILLAESARAGTQAVIFGMWSGQNEVLTEAVGYSTPGVPATIAMHYRIGGITETFLVTLLFMLAEQGRIDLDVGISRWFPDLIAADQVTVRMLAQSRFKL